MQASDFPLPFSPPSSFLRGGGRRNSCLLKTDKTFSPSSPSSPGGGRVCDRRRCDRSFFGPNTHNLFSLRDRTDRDESDEPERGSSAAAICLENVILQRQMTDRRMQKKIITICILIRGEDRDDREVVKLRSEASVQFATSTQICVTYYLPTGRPWKDTICRQYSFKVFTVTLQGSSLMYHSIWVKYLDEKL